MMSPGHGWATSASVRQALLQLAARALVAGGPIAAVALGAGGPIAAVGPGTYSLKVGDREILVTALDCGKVLWPQL